MKIKYLKINGFGKLKDKELEFEDKINIVYGKNESGKTTLQKFITGILFGLSKSKAGKDISDYDKYYPWSSLEFSGKIKYTLDNEEEYEIYRDFLKKNPIIYNNKKIDITSNYKIDKTKGVTFFEEQTGVDEKTFLDTAITEQQNVKLSKSSQTNIIQKIANLVSSGDENISYKNTLEKINKMQNEQIGSNRTSQKPINVVDNKITKLEKENLEFEDLNLEKQGLLNEKQSLEDELEKNSNKLMLIEDMKSYLESSKIKVAELDFNKQLEEEYDEKISDLKSKIDIRTKQNIRLQKKNYTTNYFIIGILIVLAILAQILLKNLIITIIPIIISIISIIWVISDKYKRNKLVKEKLKQIDELQERINKEIEILEKEKQEKSFQTRIKNERFYLELQKNEDSLVEKYSGKIEQNYIQNILALDIEELLPIKQELEINLENQKLRIHTLNIELSNIDNKNKNYENANIELESLRVEKEELVSLNTSFEIAKKCLEEAYQEMKENINPQFEENMGIMIDKISSGKYKKIVFSDENGLCVELSSGQYMPVERLSIGTIDQLYLSLRLSAISEITTEKMPIILDEAFAYFDDDRLENLLKYILEEYPYNQVIIFTCSDREKEILNKMNEVYTSIEIN